MNTQPRKVLTPGEMGQVDRATIEAGIPGIVLMENAADRVVEFIARNFSPVSQQRIVVVCGKGNNGGDGLAIARQLHVRFNPRHLWVILTSGAEELTGDARTREIGRMLSGQKVTAEALKHAEQLIRLGTARS